MVSTPFYKLILVTHRQVPISEYLYFLKHCASAGITALQLREKNLDTDLQFELAVSIKEILDPLQIPLIINDHVDLVQKIDAAGVHLGQGDTQVDIARKILGKNKIIGLSIEDISQLKKANDSAINYLAASAVFPSKNKSNLKKIWELEGVSLIRKNTTHPLVAIGGVNQSNVGAILRSGAQGIAVIGAVHDSPDPISVINQLRQIIDNYDESHNV